MLVKHGTFPIHEMSLCRKRRCHVEAVWAVVPFCQYQVQPFNHMYLNLIYHF